MGKRESGIQKRTVDRLLTEFYPHAIARVKHGDAYATVGDPDVYGCFSTPRVVGRMFAFEVKNEEGTTTKIQQQRLKEFAAAGAIVGAIRDPDEAIAIIRRELSR
jgi:hypothetical protein